MERKTLPSISKSFDVKVPIPGIAIKNQSTVPSCNMMIPGSNRFFWQNANLKFSRSIAIDYEIDIKKHLFIIESFERKLYPDTFTNCMTYEFYR